jgi:TonB-linked SusC/RagA family outer membrane protein
MKCTDYGAKLLTAIMRFALIQLFLAIMGSCLLFANGRYAHPVSDQKNTSIKNAITVKGIVSDAQGPLPGVTVTIVGTKAGASTDADGNYSIQVPVDGVLSFSLIGYTTQQIQVNNRTTINVTLVTSSKDLDEVVVVGYGTQKKANLTGAVASVSGAQLQSRPITNLGDGLNGLVPGLNVNIQNGQPGTGATFNIRGVTSIGANSDASPLVLVDGVQRDPNLIDPNDVESISVLKDAASSAIYGGRAAYGVILITTKIAKKGKPQLSYSGSYTISRPTILPKYVNSDDYIKLFGEAQRTGLASGGYTSSDPLTALDSTKAAAYRADPAHNPSAYVDPGNPKLYRYVGNTDWIKVLYPGWAPQQQHNLSLSAGEGKTSYTASIGYFRQDGLEKVANQVYQRFTPSLKLNTEVAKWLTLNLSMSLTHTDNNQGATTYVNQGGAWIPGDLRPLQPVYNPDGNFSGQGSYTNPVAVLTNSGRDIDKQNDFWTTGRVIIKPADHFNITSDFTYNNLSDFDRANLIPFNDYGVNGTFLDIFPWTNPSRIIENRKNYNYNAFNAYATYENTFNQKHYFKALVGYNQEYKHYQTDYAMAKNLIVPTLVSIGQNNDSKPVVDGTETEYALAGAFYRLNYIYDKRYLIEVNGRYDGTSRFQSDHRFAFSPSVSAGWNIAEEAFMSNLKNTISELKLRGSYGQLPNQRTKDEPGATLQYPYISTLPYNSVNYLFNNQLGQGVGAPGLVSSTFTWEKVQTRNIGLDYSLLNDRLSGSVDYYVTDTKDMLVGSQQLPAVLGTTPPTLNSANLRTKGWELSVNWKDRLFENKLFYNVTVGLSDYISNITKYNNNPTLNLSDYYPGQRLGNIWGFVTDGFYKTNAEAAAVNNSALDGYTWLAGDIKYADLNHDGKIDYGNKTVTNPGDKKIIGNSTPRYRFNFNLSLNYKSFDFTAFVQGVLKRDFDPTEKGVFNSFFSGEYAIPYTYATDRWTPTNTNAYFARTRFYGEGNQQTQTKYLQNAAYARIKQLTLGYSLPKEMLSKIGVKKVRVYVTGANLFTITSLFKGFDPELIDYQAYPVNKSLSFGLQATL